MQLTIYKLKRIIAIAFIGLSFVACKNDALKNCLQSSGEDDSRIIKLEKFTKLDIQSRHIVHFIQDTCSYVEIKGKSNLLDHVECVVSNKTLLINDHNKCRFMKGYQLTDIYLHFDTLTHINFDGNAELYSKDTLNFDRIYLESRSDMTKVSLIVNANYLSFKAHAVLGEMTIKGITNRAYFYCSGSNHLLFKDLLCKDTYVYHVSYGKVYVTSTERFRARINSSGSIFCYGSPTHREFVLDEDGIGQVYYFD